MNPRVTIKGRAVQFHGIETGKIWLLDLKLRNGSLWAYCKQDSHKYWSGIGQPNGYAPVRYLCVEVHEPVLSGKPESNWKITGWVEYPWDHELSPRGADSSTAYTLKRLQEAQK